MRFMVCSIPKCGPYHVTSRQAARAFFFADRSISNPLEYTFRNRSTSAVSFSWDFGDQSDPSYKNDRNIVSHIFPAGVPNSEADDEDTFYSVTLTATYANGDTSSFSRVINVRTIVADFTFLASGLQVQFTESSVISFAVSYLWDFQDGVTSTEQNPLHRFPLNIQDVTYQVSLTITDQAGFFNTVIMPVLILGPPNVLGASNRIREDGSNAITEDGTNRIWEGVIILVPAPTVTVDQLYLTTLSGVELEDFSGAELEIFGGEP